MSPIVDTHPLQIELPVAFIDRMTLRTADVPFQLTAGSSKPWIAGMLLCMMVACTVFAGCKEPAPQQSGGFQLKNQQSDIQLNKQSDQLDRVISQIRNEDVTEWSVFESKMTLALNNAWSILKKANQDQPIQQVMSGWKRPALLDTLPEVYGDSLWVRNFEDENFLYTDAYYLQEQYWLQRILQQTRERSQVGRYAYLTHAGMDKTLPLADALKQRDSKLDSPGSEQLALALQLFDWSLRNVSGHPFFLPTPEEAEDQALQSVEESMPRSFAGVRGPGYSQYLWQVMSYGRGDVWQQTHVFLQLARNAELDACVVGLRGKEPQPMLPRVSHPDVIPWAVGVAINDQLYLFEPRMGLPILHPETRAILTLKEVLESPELLDWYSLTPAESTSELAVYPVSRSDLDDLVFLLDYPLESTSIRAKFVHDNLVGDSRMPVYFPVDAAAERLRQLEHVEEVQLWALPLEINIFRGVIREAELRSIRDQFAAARLQWLTLNEKYFDQFPLLRESRVLFLQGKFAPDRTGLKRDCLQELQEMRYSDEEIAQVATDRNLQEALGLYRSDQSADDFSRQIRATQLRMRVVRGDVQMFLAMAHQELRNFSTALNWLDLVDAYDTDSKWERHTIYLQGRNEEAMHHYDKAIEYYLKTEQVFRSDRSPRDFGNVLRARILKQATGQ